MLKNKCKILFLLVAIFALVSTLSFATIEPRTSDDDGIMPISESEENTDVENINNGENISEGEPSSEWINSDLYLSGNKVEINQVVDGNAFVFANEVVVKGEIGGNLFVFANKLNIEGGYIYNSLFAAANEIVINGIVFDAYTVSSNFILANDGFVYRDLKVSANTLNLNGKVGRDAYLTAAKYDFNKENGALIGGNLKYSASSELDIADGIVNGEVTYNKEEIKEESMISRVFSYIFDAINALVYTFVVILLALWLAPKFVNRVTNMNTTKAFVCLGSGIVIPVVTIFTLLLLLLSIVCTHIALAITFLFIAICMSGTAFASIYFGSLLTKFAKWDGKIKFVLASLISALAIWAISQIPYIGGIFGLLVALFGIGILFVNAIYRKENVEEQIVEKI